MTNTGFAPSVVVSEGFFDSVPDAGIMKNVLPLSRLYLTNAHKNAIAKYPDLYDKVSGMNGHVVIRVSPGCDECYVIMLDDSDFKYRVTRIGGPYESKD